MASDRTPDNSSSTRCWIGWLSRKLAPGTFFNAFADRIVEFRFGVGGGPLIHRSQELTTGSLALGS